MKNERKDIIAPKNVTVVTHVRKELPYLGVHPLFGKDSGFCERDIFENHFGKRVSFDSRKVIEIIVLPLWSFVIYDNGDEEPNLQDNHLWSLNSGFVANFITFYFINHQQ